MRVFGLLAGGGSWSRLVIWAVLGAVCGGLFTYYSVHTLPKTQLGRIVEGMRPDSSAIALFTKGGDAEEVLSSVASHEPTTATLAAIFGDLSACVMAGTAGSAEGSAPPADQSTTLNMLVVRRPGQHAARQALAEARSATESDPTRANTNLRELQEGNHVNLEADVIGKYVERLLESDEHGGLKVHSPTWGVHAMARSNLISWGLLGLVIGAIASLTGGGGSWARSRAVWSPRSAGAPSVSSTVPSLDCGSAAPSPRIGSKGGMQSCPRTPRSRSPGRAAYSRKRR